MYFNCTNRKFWLYITFYHLLCLLPIRSVNENPSNALNASNFSLMKINFITNFQRFFSTPIFQPIFSNTAYSTYYFYIFFGQFGQSRSPAIYQLFHYLALILQSFPPQTDTHNSGNTPGHATLLGETHIHTNNKIWHCRP